VVLSGRLCRPGRHSRVGVALSWLEMNTSRSGGSCILAPHGTARSAGRPSRSVIRCGARHFWRFAQAGRLPLVRDGARQLLLEVRSVTAVAPRGGLSVDRGVDRRPGKSQRHLCIRRTDTRRWCRSRGHACVANERTSHNPPVLGSIPSRPPCNGPASAVIAAEPPVLPAGRGTSAGMPAGWSREPGRSACAGCQGCRSRSCGRPRRWASRSFRAVAARA